MERAPFLFLFLILGVAVVGFGITASDGANGMVAGEVGKSQYGSMIGHAYHYETGRSGITGDPDFVVTKGLGAVPVCFDTPIEKGGFWNGVTRKGNYDHVSCYSVPPDDAFGKTAGDWIVHCFLRARPSNLGMYQQFPQGLERPGVCNLEGRRMRHVYE